MFFLKFFMVLCFFNVVFFVTYKIVWLVALLELDILYFLDRASVL